ncbi:methylated-DNA--[protein]-cysteine S-methyltransferase [Ruania halotolerans]|uniref:methylated-DNA--[protein]-cysteine S-methyltransferase n=1 Tax=Ruania halotolerans TaxID=2897773 RepID=UPI001E4B8B5E|nr:methylated-DNA--[protein]-cysteine S-methyltransferase [Ruania halotolerans]UFU07189.1 methylated-DNA--[protein]-cysteine S-methyltransferase [Ruania halotolerans]
MTTIFRHDLPSPIGDMVLLSDGESLTGLLYPGHTTVSLAQDARPDPGSFSLAVAQLEEYFAGERTVFDIPINPRGTAFQRRCWDALLTIPYGTTRSYGEIAAIVGEPGAARAVGLANNRNPISIIVPCHRVIGADGSLTGYGGGMPAKRYLLDLESRGTTLF